MQTKSLSEHHADIFFGLNHLILNDWLNYRSTKLLWIIFSIQFYKYKITHDHYYFHNVILIENFIIVKSSAGVAQCYSQKKRVECVLYMEAFFYSWITLLNRSDSLDVLRHEKSWQQRKIQKKPLLLLLLATSSCGIQHTEDGVYLWHSYVKSATGINLLSIWRLFRYRCHDMSAVCIWK